MFVWADIQHVMYRISDIAMPDISHIAQRAPPAVMAERGPFEVLSAVPARYAATGVFWYASTYSWPLRSRMR